MNPLIPIIIFIAVVVALAIFFDRLRKWQYRTSFFFGRIEHASARLLFAAIVLTCIFFYASLRAAEGWLLVIDVLLWLFYFTAHNLEKAIHPKANGRRI